jgi:protein-L-isoaspartate(D-aspartate) O-methyltransferase
MSMKSASRKQAMVVAILPMAGLIMGQVPDRASFALERSLMISRIRERVRASSKDAANRELERALTAMASVERERFVPESSRADAYGDTPLPIGYDQTISDAYVVAVMTAALRLPAHANVLDVGTGSGYQAAVLALLADTVSSIEIVEPLAVQASSRLKDLHYDNVTVRAGDGFAGWPERAPFDGIVVAAGAAKVPQQLIEQLKPGGRLVMPIGSSWATEHIIVVTKKLDGRLEQCSLGWAMFVPLTGRGERSAEARGLFDRTIPLCYKRPIVAPILAPVAKQPPLTK